jgi:type IV pilus assembly protein PilB
MKAVGCDACKDGYKGRVGIYEVVRITPEIADLIMSEGNSLRFAAGARTRLSRPAHLGAAQMRRGAG